MKVFKNLISVVVGCCVAMVVFADVRAADGAQSETITSLPGYDDDSAMRWPPEKIMENSVPDPEAWVYAHVLKDGEPAFPYTHLLIWQKPFQDFVDRKLGCMKSIGGRDSKTRLDERGLNNDVLLSIVGGGLTSRMALMYDHYLVGYGCMWGFCHAKGIMILDVKNRWAAFAIRNFRNYWASENDDVVRSKYREEGADIFLVDNSSDAFHSRVLEIVSLWKKEIWDYTFNPKIPNTDLPIRTYSIQCDRPQ